MPSTDSLALITCGPLEIVVTSGTTCETVEFSCGETRLNLVIGVSAAIGMICGEYLETGVSRTRKRIIRSRVFTEASNSIVRWLFSLSCKNFSSDLAGCTDFTIQLTSDN